MSSLCPRVLAYMVATLEAWSVKPQVGARLWNVLADAGDAGDSRYVPAYAAAERPVAHRWRSAAWCRSYARWYAMLLVASSHRTISPRRSCRRVLSGQCDAHSPPAVPEDRS